MNSLVGCDAENSGSLVEIVQNLAEGGGYRNFQWRIDSDLDVVEPNAPLVGNHSPEKTESRVEEERPSRRNSVYRKLERNLFGFPSLSQLKPNPAVGREIGICKSCGHIARPSVESASVKIAEAVATLH
jgi:hypothetical protein